MARTDVAIAVAVMVIVIGAGTVLLDGFGFQPDPTPELPPNPHVAPSEQVLGVESVAMEPSGSNWTVTVELENRVIETDPGNPVATTDPMVQGTLPSGTTFCEEGLNTEIPPNGTETLTLSCTGVPMTLQTRPNGQRTQYVEGHHTEVLSHVVGYLGRNGTGHHWFGVGTEGGGSRYVEPSMHNHVACRQRIGDLNVSGVPGPRPRFHEKYSIPAEEVDYLATVETTPNGNGSSAGNASTSLPAQLDPAASGTVTHELDRPAWFDVTDALDGREIRISDDLPQEADHVTINENVTRECGGWRENGTAFSGFRNVTLRYSEETPNATHRVRMTHHTNYSTPSITHLNWTIEVRRLNQSDLVNVDGQSTDTGWARANVSSLDIPDATPRYLNVSDVPGTLQEQFVLADRRSETTRRVYVRPDMVDIVNSMDDNEGRPSPSAKEGVIPLGYPCGPGYPEWFVACDTTESSIMLEERTHFVVDYHGKLYYVLLRADY